MKLVLLSDFYVIPNEHALLNALFEEGLEFFHLRKRSYSKDQMRQYLDNIPSAYYSRTILHSHFELAKEYALKGLHFKKIYTIQDFAKDQGLTEKEVRAQYKHISHSTHSLTDIKNITFPFDYLFLSPVFDSISNVGYNSKIKIQTIRKFFKEEPNHPSVIALSGITADKVKRIYEAGFNGLGLLGHIWLDYKEDGLIGAAVQKFKIVQENIKALQNTALSL